MVTCRNHDLQEWFLQTRVFYCPTAIYSPSFVLCARLLYRNHVVWPLCSLFLTTIYMSGVFSHCNLYALTDVSLPCIQGTLLLTAIYRCGVFSFRISKYYCWSVNVVQGQKDFSDIYIFWTRIMLASHVLSSFEFDQRMYMHELAARLRMSDGLQMGIWRKS